MLTKEQKHFRKQMKEIKKEKGELYYEMYGKNKRRRGWEEVKVFNTGLFIRVILFLCLIGWKVHQSGILEQTNQVGNPSTITNTSTVRKNNLCANYIKAISGINEEFSYIITEYNNGTMGFTQVNESISDLLLRLDQIEIIPNGDNLFQSIGTKLVLTKEYITLAEELKSYQNISTVDQAKSWKNKSSKLEQLKEDIDMISNQHMGLIKDLLGTYGMSYTDNKDGSIRYWH